MLRCPDAPITLPAGGQPQASTWAAWPAIWTPDPDDLAALSYTARWVSEAPAGVDLRVGRTLELGASGASRPGTTAELEIGVAGSRPHQRLTVKISEAPLPTIQGPQLRRHQAGHPGAGAGRHHLGLVGRRARHRQGHPGERAVHAFTISGATVTFTPPGDAHGRIGSTSPVPTSPTTAAPTGR